MLCRGTSTHITVLFSSTFQESKSSPLRRAVPRRLCVGGRSAEQTIHSLHRHVPPCRHQPDKQPNLRDAESAIARRLDRELACTAVSCIRLVHSTPRRPARPAQSHFPSNFQCTAASRVYSLWREGGYRFHEWSRHTLRNRMPCDPPRTHQDHPPPPIPAVAEPISSQAETKRPAGVLRHCSAP